MQSNNPPVSLRLVRGQMGGRGIELPDVKVIQNNPHRLTYHAEEAPEQGITHESVVESKEHKEYLS